MTKTEAHTQKWGEYRVLDTNLRVVSQCHMTEERAIKIAKCTSGLNTVERWTKDGWKTIGHYWKEEMEASKCI